MNDKINKIKIGAITYDIDSGFEDSSITINGNGVPFTANDDGGYNATYSSNLIEEVAFDEDGDYTCNVVNRNDKVVAAISGAKRIALNNELITPTDMIVGTSNYRRVYKINISGDSNINVTNGVIPGQISISLGSIPKASNLSLGGIKVESRNSLISCNNPSETTDRYYKVEIDSDGKAFVNVPWVASQSENGAITEIQMNGSLVTNTNGVVDLGTVIKEDNVVVYETILDQQNSQNGYKLANNKTFNDVHADYLTNKKQINIKHIYLNGPARIYSLSHIDGSSAIFLNIDSSNINNLVVYYIVLSSSSNGYVNIGSMTIQNGSGGGSNQMTISDADSLVDQNDTLQADSNILYRFTNPVSALTIQLQQPSTSDTAVEYLFRFKTANSGVNITFTDYLDLTTDILYPFDYIINTDTEYEISVLYDGSKYLVSECAYN